MKQSNRQSTEGTVTDPAKKPVNHAELRVLTEHLSTLIAAMDVRLAECERVLPVDPMVRVQADTFVDANNRPGLALVEEGESPPSEPTDAEGAE